MRLFFWIAIFVMVLIVYFFLSRRKSKDQDQRENTVAVPARWQQIHAALQNNSLPSLHITLCDELPTSVTESKIGGVPYWPKDMPYPSGGNDEDLTFIAQINLSEIDQSPIDLPPKGLLQFFIELDDLLGLTFFESARELHSFIDFKHTKYRVVYHAELTDHDDARFSNDNIEHADESPIKGQCRIQFQKRQEIASPEDYRWNKIVKDFDALSDDELEHAFDTLQRSKDHKIGGFASFTQQDPREYLVPDENWILLFQLDSESNNCVDMMWGDCGIAQFLIREEDLTMRKFDRVWYNWDCC